MRMEPDSPPAAAWVPSGEKVTAWILPIFQSKAVRSLPVAASQKRTVWSLLALRTVRTSGEKVTA
jgi:hypothetical protein